MLDAVLDYLPSPVDIQAINGEKENGEPGERHAKRRRAIRRVGIQDCH